mgnify:CR=1 FL=1
MFLDFVIRNYSAPTFLQELLISVDRSYFLSLLSTQMERNLSLLFNVRISNESTILVILFGVCSLPNFASPIEDSIVSRFLCRISVDLSSRCRFIKIVIPRVRLFTLNLKSIQWLSLVVSNLFFDSLSRLWLRPLVLKVFTKLIINTHTLLLSP